MHRDHRHLGVNRVVDEADAHPEPIRDRALRQVGFGAVQRPDFGVAFLPRLTGRGVGLYTLSLVAPLQRSRLGGGDSHCRGTFDFSPGTERWYSRYGTTLANLSPVQGCPVVFTG